jgi:hypothetical protein
MNLLVVASLLLGAAGGEEPGGKPGNDGLETPVAAWKASAEALTSGEGTGTFLYERREPDAETWTTVTDARIEVYFDKQKYHIRMDCAKEELGAKRMIIIHDGAAIWCSRFRDGLGPVGCAGEVFPNTEVGGMVRPQSLNIPWDVSRLSYSLGNLPATVKNVGAEKITVTKTEEGDYRLSHAIVNSPKVKVEIDCLRKYGYNIGATRIYNPEKELPGSKFVATWKKDGEVWYVESIEESITVNDGQKALSHHRWKLKYDNFKANAEVPASRFEFEALEMPARTRILDRRPGAKEPIRYVPTKEESQAAMGDVRGSSR